jgi:hypothetical protein
VFFFLKRKMRRPRDEIFIKPSSSSSILKNIQQAQLKKPRSELIEPPRPRPTEGPSLELLAYERRELTRQEICPDNLIQAIYDRSLNSAQDLQKFSFTDLVRTAAHNEYLCQIIQKYWNFRPLPLRRCISRTMLFSVPMTKTTTQQGGGRGGKPSQVFTLHRWLVLLGQQVELDQDVAEVLSSSAKLIRIRSEMAGKIATRHSYKGATLRAGTPLLTFEGQTEIHLHDHQISAMRWMAEREHQSEEEKKEDENCYGISGGILKLEMGLGKTLLSLSYSLLAPAGFPTLIVSSKAVMAEWQRNGFQKFSSSIF